MRWRNPPRRGQAAGANAQINCRDGQRPGPEAGRALAGRRLRRLPLRGTRNGTSLDDPFVAHEHVLVGHVVIPDGSQAQGAAPGVLQLQSRRAGGDDRAADFPVGRPGARRKLNQCDQIAKPRSAGNENLLAVHKPAALCRRRRRRRNPATRNAAEVSLRRAGVDPAAISGDLSADFRKDFARPCQFVAKAPDDVERHADDQRRGRIAARQPLLARGPCRTRPRPRRSTRVAERGEGNPCDAEPRDSPARTTSPAHAAEDCG